MSKRWLMVVAIIWLLPMFFSTQSSSASTHLPTLNARGATAIDQMLQAAVDTGELPGVVAAITNKNQILYLKAFGKQDVARNIPMSKDSVFRIASMTKPITSVAVMMLYEQGKLRLDDAAGSYLPSLKGREVIATFNEQDGTYTTRPAKQEITIRHLLTHTSGLAYIDTSAIVLSIQQKTGKNEYDMPLLFDPGTKWHYSVSPALLGNIIEKLTGQSLEDFYQANIFRPLGMVDTSYSLPPKQAGRLVTVHQQSAAGLIEKPNPSPYRPTVRGDGGLFSTASDYCAFLQMLLNEGSRPGIRLLKPETVRLMTSNQIGSLVVEEMPTTQPDRYAPFLLGDGSDKFGLGFQITMTDGSSVHERSAGSYAWAGAFNTYFWVDPKTGIGVVFLTQEMPFYNSTARDVMKQFERLIYEYLQ